MLAKIKENSTRPPFCVPYHPIIFNDIEVPIHAYHAYDAVMIYAKALTEALRDGYDPRNGTAIMERIRNRPYHSVLGFDVSNRMLTNQNYRPTGDWSSNVLFQGLYRLERRRRR